MALAPTERLAILGIGLLGNGVLNFFFDFVLYTYVIATYGLLYGGVYMTILSILVCILLLFFYDWSKKDWLGIETIKELKEYKGKSFLARITSWAMRKSDPIILLVLSIQFDPFVTTAYMRKGAHQFNGMSLRDWKIFFTSAIIANVYWAITIFFGVTALEYIWQFVKTN